MKCCIGHRNGSDLALLWLWHRPAATAPIRTLAWEHQYAMGTASKRPKKKKKKKKKKKDKKKKKQERKTVQKKKKKKADTTKKRTEASDIPWTDPEMIILRQTRTKII